MYRQECIFRKSVKENPISKEFPHDCEPIGGNSDWASFFSRSLTESKRKHEFQKYLFITANKTLKVRVLKTN